MSDDNQQEKKTESIEEFCDRLGIKRNNRKGGLEFALALTARAPKEPE